MNTDINLLIIGTAGKYGAQLSLFYLAKELKNSGVNVTIVLPENKSTAELYQKEHISYYVVPNGLAWHPIQNLAKTKAIQLLKCIINFLAEKRIKQIIKEKQINIVHINSIGVNVGYHSAHKQRCGLVWHIREFVEEDLDRQFYNRFDVFKRVSQADSIITISKAVYEKYSHYLPQEKMHVIYNGIDPHVYSMPERKILDSPAVKICFVGRISREKGQRDLIEALDYLQHYKDSLHIKIVGNSVGSVSEENYLKDWVRSHNWEKQVTFVPYCDQVADIYFESDISVIGSKMEAFGRVTIESMMAGCLVIGTSSGATEELIARQYGLTYDYGDAKALATRIEYAISSTGRTKMRETARAAQTYALEHFTAAENAANILSCYYHIEKQLCKKG